jgi:preprotein translocase subunit SecB
MPARLLDNLVVRVVRLPGTLMLAPVNFDALYQQALQQRTAN